MCPLYDQRTTPDEEDTEKFVIYHVKKEEFDTCQIMSAHPRILAQCDKPYSLRYFTISFRPFSPTPGALEFHPGQDYYFISTSSKSDLHRRVDGMCRSNNMRIVFKVADRSSQQYNRNRKDFSSTTDSKTTTTTSTTTEVMFPSDFTKEIDNYAEPNQFGDNNVHEEVDTIEDELKKKKKKKKKKKAKKDKKNNKTDIEEEESVVVVAQEEEDMLMNDNPRTQIRQKEPSLVEKVNNLMKQEASIGSISGSEPNLSSSQRLYVVLFAFLQLFYVAQHVV